MTSRRNLLIGGGIAGLVAVGGAGFLLLGGGGPSGPAGTAKTFMKRLAKGNTEGANKLVHSDAPLGQVPSVGGGGASGSVSVSKTEVTSQTEREATVDVTLELSASGFTQTQTYTVELRKEGSDWKVWSVGFF